MGLFGFGKKKEEKTKEPACVCNGGYSSSEAANVEKMLHKLGF